MKFPVQIQADNQQADDANVTAMCRVYDLAGLSAIFGALCKCYLHVVAWDADGTFVQSYDNR